MVSIGLDTFGLDTIELDAWRQAGNAAQPTHTVVNRRSGTQSLEFHYYLIHRPVHVGRKFIVPACHTCGVQLASPVRQRHTVYAWKLFLVGGRHYCRHHVVAAAVAAGVVTKFAAGGNP